jgi:hypothetical protein
MRTLMGRCHCGNIHYTVTWPAAGPVPVRACSCDYCARHGAAWTSHPDARLALAVTRPEDLTDYRFGTGTASFHLCARCGILTHALCEIDGDRLAVINANTLEELEPADFVRTVTDFAGEDVAARLARRRRNWMPAALA